MTRSATTLRAMLWAGVVAATTLPAAAADFTILHRFTGGAGGIDPGGPLALGSQGDLYGVTRGRFGQGGVVYRLSQGPGGHWRETVLHSFAGASAPNPGLTIGRDGSLYGSLPYSAAGGSVFRLTPPGAPLTPWTYADLFDFPGQDARGGGTPAGTLLLDRRGDLFGVTEAGGAVSGRYPCACGVAYELSPSQRPGRSDETVLHAFQNPPDGGFPSGGLTPGPDGTLFGATSQGGTGGCLDGSNVAVIGCGTVFSLGVSDGRWIESTLYDFRANEQNVPFGALAMGPDGALYGAAGLDVYRLAPPTRPGGPWRKQVIYEFPGGFTGTAPAGGVVFDRAGNLYGTSRSFGLRGVPTLYRLSPPASSNAPWNETTLFRFAGGRNFVEQPNGSLVRGPGDTFYGAIGAGDGQDGYVFSFHP